MRWKIFIYSIPLISLNYCTLLWKKIPINPKYLKNCQKSLLKSLEHPQVSHLIGLCFDIPGEWFPRHCMPAEKIGIVRNWTICWMFDAAFLLFHSKWTHCDDQTSVFFFFLVWGPDKGADTQGNGSSICFGSIMPSSNISWITLSALSLKWYGIGQSGTTTGLTASQPRIQRVYLLYRSHPGSYRSEMIHYWSNVHTSVSMSIDGGWKSEKTIKYTLFLL